MPCITMSQPWVYTCPFPLEPPSHLPPHPTPFSVTEQQAELPASYSKFPLTVLHMAMHVFPRHSLNPSHCLLPRPCPRVCSLCPYPKILAEGWAVWSRKGSSKSQLVGMEATLMAESEEELKGLLMKVKEESEKVGLKLKIQKTKIMASGPTTSWKNRWGNSGNSVRLYFSGLPNHCRW